MIEDIDFRELRRRHSNGVVMEGVIQFNVKYINGEWWEGWKDIPVVIGEKGNMEENGGVP